MSKTPRVFVGMSGGVDSSVAALRLKQQGYDVAGVFIKVWHPDWLKCNWETERLDAMRVAAFLDIPFLTCDAETAYRDQVAQYFIAEYKAGRTPNPDVMCNKFVKFGSFLNFAKEHGADYIATGHYARRVDTERGVELHRGIDPDKDQSYFLWTLTADQLKHTLLPVGDTMKHQLRQEATAAGLPTATKKDSQGVCFLGHIDIPEFLSHYVTLEPGKVLDKTGRVVGQHQGALVYTYGQRHGFTVTHTTEAGVPQYVQSKDVVANTITVAPERPTQAVASIMTLSQLNLRSALPTTDLSMQTRYRQTPIPVILEQQSANELKLKLLQDVETPAPGQSCVLYQGSLCLGGGIIE